MRKNETQALMDLIAQQSAALAALTQEVAALKATKAAPAPKATAKDRLEAAKAGKPIVKAPKAEPKARKNPWEGKITLVGYARALSNEERLDLLKRAYEDKSPCFAAKFFVQKPVNIGVKTAEGRRKLALSELKLDERTYVQLLRVYAADKLAAVGLA